MKNAKPTDRRAFLKGAAAAGGAVTVGLAAGSAVAEPPDGAVTPDVDAVPAKRGYRETAHIARYYRLARD